MRLDRETALRILRKHNKDETHVRHALAVEGTMRHFARRAGADEDLWGVVGILHDIDWEMTSDAPERHCHLAPELLREEGIDEDIIHAVQSHGYGICTDVELSNDMERTLFTIDELTGRMCQCLTPSGVSLCTLSITRYLYPFILSDAPLAASN